MSLTAFSAGPAAMIGQIIRELGIVETIHHQSEEYKETTSIYRTPNWVKNPSFCAAKGAEDGIWNQ